MLGRVVIRLICGVALGVAWVVWEEYLRIGLWGKVGVQFLVLYIGFGWALLVLVTVRCLEWIFGLAEGDKDVPLC